MVSDVRLLCGANERCGEGGAGGVLVVSFVLICIGVPVSYWVGYWVV